MACLQAGMEEESMERGEGGEMLVEAEKGVGDGNDGSVSLEALEK